MAPLSLFQVHTQRKRKMAANGEFSKTLIFFQHDFSQHLGPDACSAVRGQQFRAKNIKVTKNISNIFRIANILYSTRA